MPQQRRRSRSFEWLNSPIVLTALIFALASSRADATPIPTGTAANDLIVNFNFLSPAASPAPPYSGIVISLSASSTPTFSAVLDEYGDLDGANLVNTIAFSGIGGGSGFTITLT